MNRRHHMSENTVVKQVNNELYKLNSRYFDPWKTRVSDITQQFHTGIIMKTYEFKNRHFFTVLFCFISSWDVELRNFAKKGFMVNHA